MERLRMGHFFRAFLLGMILPLSFIASQGRCADRPPNIYLFPFPPGFQFERSPVRGNEIWKLQGGRQTIQIARLTDRKRPIRSYSEAKSFLKAMVGIQMTALIGLAQNDSRVDQARYRWVSAHRGFVFEIRGRLHTTAGDWLRYVDRRYVWGRQVYQFLYTEPGQGPSKISVIDRSLKGFWPKGAGI